MSVVVADREYDSEDNYVLVREEELHAFNMISARYEYVPILRTYGKYRKEMKHGYSKIPYHQERNKDETIISVIKRLFGEHITSSILLRTQNSDYHSDA